MKFVRAIAYVAVVCGIIFSWEYCRENFFTKFEIQKVVLKNEKTDQTQKTIEAIPEKEIVEKTPKVNSESDLMVSFENGFEKIAKGAMHSVVNVATMQLIETDERSGMPDIFKGGPFDDVLKDFFDFPQKKKKAKKANALGSGFIIKVDKDKAYIVTNNHVVDKAKKIVVFLSNKTELPAEVHAVDSRTDIAVLSVSFKDLDLDIKKLSPMKWGDSDKLNEGNFVIAIGNPFGLGSTVTHGIVSAKGRNISMGKTSLSISDDFIQHSAPINMGNSGGCLLDIHGKVIGINNAIFSTSGGNIGIGFAIPSNLAKITVDQLIKHKRTFRGWLGAEVHSVNAKQAESVGLLTKSTLDTYKVFGAYVARVVPNGPAEKSGVKVGDIIIEFNGKKITEKCSLQMAVGTAEIGSSVKAKVWRQKNAEKWEEVEISVKVGDFENAIKTGNIDAKDKSTVDKNEEDVNIGSLGITISSIPEQYKAEYPDNIKVVVTKIDEEKGTSFYGPIFMPGDGFISANNKRVASVSQFKDIIKQLEDNKENKNRPIPFVILRGGSQMMIATTLDFSELDNKSKKKNSK